MWISRKEYEFLKENAEKNINAECEILKAKEEFSRATARAMKEYSAALEEIDRLKADVTELAHQYEECEASLSYDINNNKHEQSIGLYHAYYKVQHYDKEDGVWYDTYYQEQSIVVFAISYAEAKLKIEKCLTDVEKGCCRAVLNGDIVKCIGLDMRHGFEDAFEVQPIYAK